MSRAIADEKPSQSTLEDWNNDAIRVKEFYQYPACDIELEHVNQFINQYHADHPLTFRTERSAFSKLFLCS
jgi:hypothetical protein